MSPIAYAALILAVIALAGVSILLVEVAGVPLMWLGFAAMAVAVLVRGAAWK